MNLRKYFGKSDFTSLNDDVEQVLHKFIRYNNEQFVDIQQAVDDIERNASESTDVLEYRSLRDLLGIANEFVYDFTIGCCCSISVVRHKKKIFAACNFFFVLSVGILYAKRKHAPCI